MHVQLNGPREGGFSAVRQAILLSSRFYDRCNGSVMHVTNVREQMVLNLVVESAAVPSQ